MKNLTQLSDNRKVGLFHGIVLFSLLIQIGCFHSLAQNKTNKLTKLESFIEKQTVPGFITFKDKQIFKAKELFSKNKALFDLGVNDEIINYSVEAIDSNFKVYRFQQYYKNIPIEFSNLIVHERNNAVKMIIGDWFPGIQLTIIPAITEQNALQYALNHINAQLYLWDLPIDQANQMMYPAEPSESYFPQATLCIFNDDLNKSSTFHLAYRFEINAINPEKRSNIYIDAQTGKVLHNYNLISNDETPANGKAKTLYSGVRDIKTTNVFNPETGEFYYTLKDNTRGAEIETLDEKSDAIDNNEIPFKNNNIFWIANGNPVNSGMDVHWAMGMIYDYFLNTFNRRSFNNSEKKILGKAHYGIKWNNASWNGLFFKFGDGDGIIFKSMVGIDLVAHEYTHAVIQYSVGPPPNTSTGLINEGESGALNEGIADIFGTAIEMAVKGGNWTIGEEWGRWGPVRSLSNPKGFSAPTTYQAGPNWKSTASPAEANDYGGIHTNCSVMGHWFYLLAMGGEGVNDLNNEFFVEGIGVARAAEIVYRALTIHVSNANCSFAEMAEATRLAAKNLTNDDCSPEVVQSRNAWYAVGVGDLVLKLKKVVITQPDCNQSNGEIHLSVKGPEGDDIFFDWSNSCEDSINSNLAPDSYTVSISTIAEPCPIDKSFTLKENNPIVLFKEKKDESACHKNDGVAFVTTISGGGDNPTFKWSNGQEANLLMNLAGGDYVVTVTNSESNCKSIDTVKIVPFKPKVKIRGGGEHEFCAEEVFKRVTIWAEDSFCYKCKYYWNLDFDTIKSIKVPGGVWFVIAMDSAGCANADIDSVTIKIKDCSDDPTFKIPVFYPQDPNDIVGPLGYGVQQYVAKKDNLNYVVHFENDPDFATAPATKIIIDVPIDDNVDMFSLRLSEFGFGSFTFNPPPNSTFYNTRLDVADSLGVWVDLTAGIDVNTRKAFWIFQSIDPATGIEPVDPLMGFLPVNDSLFRRGEGYVSFSWKAKNNTITGDTISAKASIVFDINEALATNIWTNIVDALPPTTSVSSFVSQTDSSTIHLSITGSDDPGGTGIKYNSLYVSDNNGLFTKFNAYLPGDPIIFKGTAGHTYRFFSLGTDNVDQTEAYKNTAETQVYFYEPVPMVGGVVSYFNYAQTPLSQVNLKLIDQYGLIRDSIISDNSGEYALFPPTGGNYTISANTNKAWGGSNASDALLVLRHFVGLGTLTGLKLKSADVNNTMNINAIDALHIAKKFVDPTFVFNASDWQFEKDTLAFNDADITYNFKGICTGDVDGSYIPPILKPQPTLSLLEKNNLDIRVSEITDIPISVGKDIEVGAISLVFNYEEDFFDIIDIIPGGQNPGNLVFNAKNGSLRIAWYHTVPMNLGKGDILLKIRVKVKDQLSSIFTFFTLDGISSLGDGKAKQLNNINLFIPKLRIDIPNSFSFCQNQPNPFQNATQFTFTLLEKSMVQLQIKDLMGKEIISIIDAVYEKGSHSINIDGSQLSNGIYLAEFTANGQDKNFKEVIRIVKIGR